MPFPPMPPAPNAPIKPHALVGTLTDRTGSNIATGTPVIADNETHTGNQRVLSRASGEIMINLANISDWSVGDNIRIQAKDSKGNGEIWYTSPAANTGHTSISKELRPINPALGKRLDRYQERSLVKA